jgi:Bacterial regulatory proteins, luxR family.
MGRRAEPKPEQLERTHIVLSEQEKTVAKRYFGQDMSASDVADTMDIGETTVYNYKNRAEEKIENQQDEIIKMVRQQAYLGNRETLEDIKHELDAVSDEYGLDGFTDSE